MEAMWIISCIQLPSSIGLLSCEVDANVLISFITPEVTPPEQRESRGESPNAEVRAVTAPAQDTSLFYAGHALSITQNASQHL